MERAIGVMAGEFLSHAEVVVRAEGIRMALNSLMFQKSSAGKPSKKCSDEGKTAGAAWVRGDDIPNGWPE